MANITIAGRDVSTGVLQAVARFCLRRPVLTLVTVNLLATLLVYVPLYENQDGYLRLAFSGLSMDNIYRYWDGPLYMVVAKTFYNVGSPEITAFADLTPGYYAAHFPGYPATIRLFAFVFGYANGMIAATIAATSLSLWVLHQLLKDLGLGEKALWLGLVFVFLPPRWLIYHSVGAAEPLLILETLAFILFFRRRQYWLAGWLCRCGGGVDPEPGHTTAAGLPATNRLGTLPGGSQAAVAIGGSASGAAHGALRIGPVIIVRAVPVAVWRLLRLLPLGRQHPPDRGPLCVHLAVRSRL